MRHFNLSHKYGNEYNSVNRGFGEAAQKHKSHHVVHLLAASLIRTSIATPSM